MWDKLGTLDIVSEKTKPDIKKPRQVRIYLSGEVEAMFNSLVKNAPDLAETEVARILVAASLRALKEHDYRLSFPLKFEINEAPEKYRSPPSAIVLNEKKR